MAFTDWDVHTSSVTIAPTTSSPLVGSKSLRMTAGPASSGTLAAGTAMRNVTQEYAFTIGRYRSVFKQSSAVGSTGYFGFAVMQSAANPLSTGQLYTCQFGGGGVGIYKYSSGGLNGSGSALATAVSVYSAGTAFAAEFEWIADLTNLGGVALTVRVGTALDYADLADVLTYTDSASPFTTTAGESLLGLLTLHPSLTLDVRIDTTALDAVA